MQPPPPVEPCADADAVTLIFEGRRYRVRAGGTVAGALARLGVWDLSRSLKYHRPMGAHCLSGSCAQCATRIDGLPNRLACRTPVRDGIRVERQNVLLSRRLDPVYLAHKVLGFTLDHHHFMARPRMLNRLFVAVARRLSGLGRLPDGGGAAPRLPVEHRSADALVVGAGVSGLAAVERLAGEGRPVLWVALEAEPGGSLLGLPEALRERHGLSPRERFERATRLPGVTWLPESRVLGWYEDAGWVVRTREALLCVRTHQSLLCTGTTDLLPAFPGGLLPGVLTPSGARQLLLCEGYRPRGLVVLAGGGARLALLEEALRERGDRVLSADEALAAKGYLRLSAAKLRYQGRETWVGLKEGLLVVEGGAAPALELFQQAGGTMAYRPGSELFRPEEGTATAPDGCEVSVLGTALTGPEPDETKLLEDAQGLITKAEELLSQADDADLTLAQRKAVREAIESWERHRAAAPSPYRARAFVCACEDVTAAELHHAIARGYADMETLKRYTGLSTGPCQGKICLTHGARALAAERGAEAVRATRFRPPTGPVSLAEAAGEEQS